ncbi:S8 family serine peptidase [Maribacter chungangensis]|uniref:S8 family serine peptidase n=1 Tax=Maribacter chungangensis TaxID=1069117 RepID=A0ABW3AYP1_9FLAO
MDYQSPRNFLPIVLFALMMLLCANYTVSAQSDALKKIIKKDYDFSKIGAMHVDLEFDFEENRRKTLALAKTNHWKLSEVMKDGTKVALQEIGTDGSPLYYETYSDNASRASRANTLHANGIMDLNLDGSGMQVGVWDSGVALTTHQEYDIRAVIGDGSKEIDNHATMVSGSLISAGIKKEAQGVAYRAKVLSNDWSRDKIEVATAAANGLLLSNHSYGIKTDRVPDWYFGSYIKVSQDWDRIMYNAPYYLMVNAAGNAQKRNDNLDPIAGNSADGFDLMLGFTLTKNSLTVAAADTKIARNGDLKSASVSAYSSFGPVDDGRIKPDIAGDGSSIFSTASYTNNSYGTSSGTSMATPGVTGALLLLQQYNEQLYGTYMRAATLKGLTLHTADDVAQPGPDYKLGWGVMNAKKAAELLLNRDYGSLIEETTLEEGETFSLTVSANGLEDLKVSICWTDPESDYINRGSLNDTTAALVNDLDIRITQNGIDFYPWKLDALYPNAAASKGDNQVDPFEQIEIANAKGSYTITVTHKGDLRYGKQDFTLFVSGAVLTDCVLSAPEGAFLSDAKENEISVQWDPLLDALYEVQYKKTTDKVWHTHYTTEPGITLDSLEVDIEYVFRLRTFCSQNIASAYSMEYLFAFLGENTIVGPLEAFETLELASEINFSVYPNPAVEYIGLHEETSESARYSIMSLSGTTVKNGAAKNAKISVADLAGGLYILQVVDDHGKRSAKFYKQ